MEFQKITNFSTQSLVIKIYRDLLLKNGLRFMINQKKNYSVNEEIRIKTSMLRSNICDFSDAYLVVKGDITVTETDNAKRNKSVAFKKQCTIY